MAALDKTIGDLCPRCGQRTLSIYYEEGSDLQLGARCEECGLKGFFVNGKLVPLATT
jgi:DNA-directed RNA polymerase subunit RPC12/RpoP